MPYANIRIRRRIMEAIAGVIERRGLTQREAAELFRTTQPRISEIVRGKVDEFTIDSLVNMLAGAGMRIPLTDEGGAHEPHADPGRPDPVVEAYRRDIDGTLIREALRRTPTERVRALAHLQALADEAGRAGRRGRRAR